MITGSEIRISVVIPLYNKENSIRKTIDSVLSQTFTDFELIIVNDGSTDNSFKVVSEYCNSKIRLFCKENGGVSSARNFGIIKARYDYIAFLDADDYWDSIYLQQMSLLISKYPSAVMLYCPYKQIGKKGYHKSNKILNKKEEYNGLIPLFKFSPKNWPSSSSTIIKKTAKILFFDESLLKGEDIDFWIRIALQGEVAYINTPMAYYNLAAENRAMSIRTDKHTSLIWNLHKYQDNEMIKPDLTIYLDRIRIARIEDFLSGDSIEIDQIDSLINDLSFKYYNLFWKLLRLTPYRLRTPIFKAKNLFHKLIRHIHIVKIYILTRSKNALHSHNKPLVSRMPTGKTTTT
jgi:glycosyltransferase involved in cell wall biosynthesis